MPGVQVDIVVLCKPDAVRWAASAMNGHRYRILSVNRPLGIGVTDSQNVSLSAVAKRNVPEAPYCVPNEIVCNLLGSYMCLPVLAAGIVYMPTPKLMTPWFTSLDFNLTNGSLPPVDTRACVKQLPSLSTGLLLFDSLVANPDRHRSNFSVDFLSSPPQMRIFDHSHALFGKRQGECVERMRELRDRLATSGGSVTEGNRHCLLDVLDTSRFFDSWLKRVEGIHDFQIEYACHLAVGLGVDDKEAGAAISFLKHRRDNLRSIIKRNRPEFKSITTWELFL